MMQSPTLLRVFYTACLLESLTSANIPQPRTAPAQTSRSGCAALFPHDSAEALDDARWFASGPQASRIRASQGFPSVPPDSVHFVNNGAACDSIATRYRAFRVIGGDSSYDAPVGLIRLGPSGMFLATARVAKSGRDYILLDSLFRILRRIDLGT